MKTENTTSDVCPICGGIGWVYDIETNTAYECECYKESLKAKRLEFATIPEEYEGLTINNFDINIYKNPDTDGKDPNVERARVAKEVVAGYVVNFDEVQRDGKGLFFYSRTRGSGKTRLAASLGNALIKVKGQRVRFITTLELLGKIKATYNRKSEYQYTDQELIDEFCEVPVLILDDLGVEKESSFVTETFFRILDSRMTHKKITIVTSNLTIAELKQNERIKSRLRKMTLKIQLPEIDVRSQLAEIEEREYIAKLRKCSKLYN